MTWLCTPDLAYSCPQVTGPKRWMSLMLFCYTSFCYAVCGHENRFGLKQLDAMNLIFLHLMSVCKNFYYVLHKFVQLINKHTAVKLHRLKSVLEA